MLFKILDSVVGKNLCDPNRKPLVSVDEESNAIVVMGLSDEIEAIGTLVTELDKKKVKFMYKQELLKLMINWLIKLNPIWNIWRNSWKQWTCYFLFEIKWRFNFSF